MELNIMVSPKRVNFKIYQGSTFEETLRWESAYKTFKDIVSITKTAPPVIGSIGHGIPIGWRVKLANIGGMKELNSDDYNIVTDITTDSITLGYVNASGYTTYTSGGVIEYNTPNDLSGITARMQLRSKITSDTVLAEYTTADSTILIDNSLKTITISVPASETELYTFKTAVYSMELINGSEVMPFIYGSVTLESEITR